MTSGTQAELQNFIWQTVAFFNCFFNIIGMHGIFPTLNKYYISSELFPRLSKEEKKAVFFPERKSKKATSPHHRAVKDEDEDTSPVKIKHKK
jgi:hypothetical protein